ncbi:MAG: sigma-70 family RNA polymerase sigma factor [Oscillospiraceae bacterium]|nr:sigma-70 family RNA polymerase sigma factor [Oscillospiraceae bacterium]
MTPPSDLTAVICAAQAGDDGACERLFSENTGLIWSVVRRYFGRGVDPDDLYQLGCIGFLKAVRGFDPSFATQFSTYAVPKIAGEVRRFLRDDGPVKVSRGAREKAVRVKQARETLCQKLGREPALSELAGQCGLSAEEIASVELAVAPPESFQCESREGGRAPEDLVGVEGLEDEVIRRMALRESIDRLPPQERMVILLRYFRDFTQAKTAQVLGVSQVQVSRIERRAVNDLREHWE